MSVLANQPTVVTGGGSLDVAVAVSVAVAVAVPVAVAVKFAVTIAVGCAQWVPMWKLPDLRCRTCSHKLHSPRGMT